MLGLLRQFPGYTLTTLMQEDTLLLRLLAIEALGTPDEPETAPEGGGPIEALGTPDEPETAPEGGGPAWPEMT